MSVIELDVRPQASADAAIASVIDSAGGLNVMRTSQDDFVTRMGFKELLYVKAAVAPRRWLASQRLANNMV